MRNCTSWSPQHGLHPCGAQRQISCATLRANRGRTRLPYPSPKVVLRGKFHVRHFERIADEPDYLILRPTIDALSEPGDLSSISDERDNVHWLLATDGPAYPLDVLVP